MQGAQLFGETGRMLVMSYGAKANGLAAWAAAMIMHESADGTSNVSKSCNNYAGITFVKQPGATQCSNAQPGSEGGRTYAKFPDYKAFLKDYVRILKMNRSGQGAPWTAKNLREFVTRLKLNGYFSDSIDNYLAALDAKLKKYYQPAFIKAWAKTASQGGHHSKYMPVAAGEKKRADQQKRVDEQRARANSKSLSVWFENLNALNKALVIGVSGFIVMRLLDR